MGSKISTKQKPLHHVECTEYQENEDPCLIPNEKLQHIRNLGNGSFGVVSLYRWEKSNGQVIEVAVKMLRNVSNDAEKEALQEIRNMQKLNDLNIVRLFGITIHPIQVVVEVCDGGSLLQRLRDPIKPVLLVTQLLDYSKQLCSGMAYLESQRCVHRDLAARNVLLTNKEKTIKISDFGLTRFLEMDQLYYKMNSTNTGIPYPWCSPEAIKDKKFSHQSDVWSFGVTLWEMFTYGAMPWSHCSINQVLTKITSNEKLCQPEKGPVEIYEIMCSCWVIEREKRPSFFTLKPILLEKEIITGECQTAQSNSLENGLALNKGEKVLIIDEQKSPLWFGQSMKSRKFGYFHKSRILKMIKNGVEETDYAPIVMTARHSIGDFTSPRRSFDKYQNGYEVPRANGYENADKVNIEVFAVGRTNLIIQIEGIHIVMYPQTKDLLKILEKEQLDCCIGSPCENVIRHLNNRFPQLTWVTWRTESVADIQKYDISKSRIYLTRNYQKQLLNIKGVRFKIYKNKNGYIIGGPTSRVLYLWPINITENSKKQIARLRPIDVAVFSIHTLKHVDEVKETFALVRAQKTILIFAKHYPNEEKEKFIKELVSKGIRQEGFILLEENEGYRHHMCKVKASRGSYYQRWRRNTNESEAEFIPYMDNEAAEFPEINNP